MPIADPTYTPPPYLHGGHRQTLYASLARRVDFTYDRRERITTPDADFLDLDWAETTSPNTQRVGILTHGLEGSADRGYMRGMAQAFVRREWDVCALNLRGCSGEPNRQVVTYHSGKTDDLDLVVEHVLAQGYSSVALIGFSLGGNLTLKYLGERGGEVNDHIHGAVALSAPIDLKASAQQIDRWSNWHYTQYFLRSLAQKIRRIALEKGIPIVERKPLARALYADVEIGKQVPSEQYAAVAEVLRYVYELKGKPLPTAR